MTKIVIIFALHCTAILLLIDIATSELFQIPAWTGAISLLAAVIASGMIGVNSLRKGQPPAVAIGMFCFAIGYSLLITALVFLIAIAIWGVPNSIFY